MNIYFARAKRNQKSRLQSRTNVSRSRLLPATLGGAYLHRRYHIDPRVADLLAACAGLGQSEVR
jgi:hypothetical protein